MKKIKQLIQRLRSWLNTTVVVITLPEKSLEEIEILKERLGVEDNTELINAAFSLLDWTADVWERGDDIAIVGNYDDRFEVVSVDWLPLYHKTHPEQYLNLN